MTKSLDSLIYSRRSIRKYQAKEPDEKVIIDLIRTANQAPSPSNQQTTRVFYLSSMEKRQLLQNNMEKNHRDLLLAAEKLSAKAKTRNLLNYYWRFSSFMFNSPIILAIGFETNRSSFSSRLAESGLIKNDLIKINDLNITTGLFLSGLLLKAEESGLASCVLTAPLVFAPALEELLDISGVKINCFVTLGYADEMPAAPPRKEIKEIYHLI